MRRAIPLLIATSALAGACSSSGDSATTTDTAATVVTTPDTDPAVPDTSPPDTTPSTDTVASTDAPTTTIDDATLLADAEAAYLEAFAVGKQVLRDPDNPNNGALLEQHYTEVGIEAVQENLRLTREGSFIAVENTENPSFAEVIKSAEFVDGADDEARMTVCEFNSDRIFELGTGPDGADTLRRDDPVTILFVVRMQLVEGVWKANGGTRGEEIRDEVARCDEAS